MPWSHSIRQRRKPSRRTRVPCSRRSLAAHETPKLALQPRRLAKRSFKRSPAVTRIISGLTEATQNPCFDPNRLAGELLQTPLIAAVTGNNANEGVARLRHAIVDVLLQKGAAPDKEEMYPMAVDAVIRAAVFNHLEILKKFEARMAPEAMKRALNQKPAVNGL